MGGYVNFRNATHRCDVAENFSTEVSFFRVLVIETGLFENVRRFDVSNNQTSIKDIVLHGSFLYNTHLALRFAMKLAVAFIK